MRGTIFAQLDFRALPSTTWIARKPASLHAHLQQTCEGLMGLPWEFPRPTQTEQGDEQPKGEDALGRQAVKAQNRYRQQQRLHFHAAFEAYLDACLSDASHTLQYCLDTSDLNGFWGAFWTTVELAVAQFTQADCETGQKNRGRATQLVRKTKTQTLAHRTFGEAMPTNLPDWVLGIRRQANRCQWLASVLALRAKPKGTTPPTPLSDEFVNAKAKLVKFLRWHLHNPHLLFDGLPQGKRAGLKPPPTLFRC